MNRLRVIPLVAGVTLTVALQTNGRAAGRVEDGNQTQAVTDAVVDFGSPQPQPTPAQLSRVLVPDEVTITAGGTVTFRVNGMGHGIAIYPVSKNTTREDITSQLCTHDPTTDLCGLPAFANGEYQIVDGRGKVVIDVPPNPPSLRIDDPTKRLLGTAVVIEDSAGTPIPGAFHSGTAPGNPTLGTHIQFRFEKTGRYLVICMNRIHWLNDWMFGFVNVVD